MKITSTQFQTTLAKTLLLLLTASVFFISCKKEEGESAPLKTKMIGRWGVDKIETTIGSTAPTTVTYQGSEYVDFKGTEDDIVEINVDNISQSGTYSVLVGDTFFMQIGGKLYNCTTTVVEPGRLEFNATEDGSNPLVVKKYFLRR